MFVFNLTIFIPAMFCAVVMIPYLYMWNTPTLPTIDLNELWGNEDVNDTSIETFTIKWDPAMIADLKQRLLNATTIDALEGINFEYGFSPLYFKTVMQYWANNYSFSDREAFFNTFKHYRTTIQGLKIHFMRVTANNTNASIPTIPLLISHGWPGSFREFYEALPLLTTVTSNSTFALDIIIPSLPGFGCSDAPIYPGCGADKIAVILRNLMHRIGYTKFYMNGGDWGGIITKHCVTLFPDEVLGYIANFPLIMTSDYWGRNLVRMFDPSLNSTDFALRMLTGFVTRTGYLHIQATRPDTIGVALRDNPACLATYVFEKFAGSINQTDGGLTNFFSMTKLLDNLMVFQTNGKIVSAMRIYAESFNKRLYDLQLDAIPSKVPTVAVQAVRDISFTDTATLQIKFPNLISNTQIQGLGHFQAFENPPLFNSLIMNAMTQIIDWRAKNIK